MHGQVPPSIWEYNYFCILLPPGSIAQPPLTPPFFLWLILLIAKQQNTTTVALFTILCCFVYFRFSRFLSGQNHINTEEQVAHDWAHNDTDSSDEDDSYSEQTASPHSSSMNSSQHSYDDSPIRPPPSPSRFQGQRSPHRHHMDSVHYRSPSNTPGQRPYRTTYY